MWNLASRLHCGPLPRPGSCGSRCRARETEYFTHCDDGNLTQDSRWTYVWNSENRLATMTTRTGLPGNLPRLQLSFLYDYQGRRIRKIVAEDTGSGYDVVSTNYFLYSSWNLIAQLDPAMTPTRTYAWGTDLSGTLQGAGGVGGLLSIDNGSTNWLTAYDGNGNLTALVDAADGSLDVVYEYDPYGNLLRASGPAAENNPFRFSTKYRDVESGLIYYGYRYDSPGLGRWLNRDPIGERGGWNLYAFVWNIPVMSIDLLGRQAAAPVVTPGAPPKNPGVGRALVRVVIQDCGAAAGRTPSGLLSTQLHMDASGKPYDPETYHAY